MADPLNPALYRNLKRVFGNVVISNEGVAFVGRYVPRATGFLTSDSDDGEELYVENSGEYYRVNCNKCTDTRHRLYINHMWGKRDDRGRRNLWMATCYNDPTCYSEYETRQELYERLSEIRGVLEDARIKTGVIRKEASIVDPPGPIITLDKLPPNHPANVYLASRYFDPELLGRAYGVGYCPNSMYYLARERIYFPIMQGGHLRGWQCRHVGELDWKDKRNPPKSFNCPDMMRGHVLYGLDQAKQYKTGVLVEGPTSRHNFGPMAMASLGFPITDNQSRLVVPGFKDYSMVMLFDPDVLDRPSLRRKYDQVYEALSGEFRHGLAAVALPKGYDPADLDRLWIREYVRKEAKAQGVKVRWEKR